MNISNELLEEFNIISMSLKNSNKSISCFPVKFEIQHKTKSKIFQFNCLENISDKFDFYNHEKNILTITIKKQEKFLFSEATINILEFGLNYFIGEILSCDDFFKNFINRIKFLEYQDTKYGRRKEPRIVIGKENANRFGLSTIEQKIYLKKEQLILPCVILDVSLHGICIITPFENSHLKSIDNFSVQISFNNPLQNIILQVHKVHIKLNPTQNKVYATISCQLLEPISYIWKERVIKMFEY